MRMRLRFVLGATLSPAVRGCQFLHDEHRRKAVEREGLLMSLRRNRSHGEHPGRVVDEHTATSKVEHVADDRCALVANGTPDRRSWGWDAVTARSRWSD